MENLLVLIFNMINIKIEKLEQLNNCVYSRDNFISRVNFNNISFLLPKLRNEYPGKIPSNLSDYSLRQQRWPLLNIVRQSLKYYNYIMIPIRESKKNNKNDKRQYNRFFKITKIPN